MFVNWFIESSQQYPHRAAVEVDNKQMTYKELALLASRIAAVLQKHHIENSPIGLLTYRSFISYGGILGIMYSKNIYLPLNPYFPQARTKKMIELVDSGVLIVDHACKEYVLKLLPELKKPMVLIFPDLEKINGISSNVEHNYIFSNEIENVAEQEVIKDADEDAVAYLIFTSGSTGEPKIVPQTNQNVFIYLDHVAKRYDLNENDRVSQTFELTFDNSIHDMFICWKYGACLYCVPRNYLMMPAGFIKDKQLTVWYSVPSIGLNMLRLNRLKEKSLPSLRYTLFCGEALPKNLAKNWAKAADNSTIENYYGITETTHQVSVYKWDPEKSEEECINDIVPIGKVFAGLQYCILNDNKTSVAPGEAGELYVSGPQITKGYYNDPARTKQSYLEIPHMGDAIWFKTGDLVKERPDGNLNYLGRLDNQVQILGNRVELQEVDCILKRACNSEMVVSLAWPVKNGVAESIVAFIAESEEKEKAKIIAYCKNSLPPYMVPQDIFFIDAMPLNDNGKFDKKKLLKILENQS
ncbi:MAG: AMP-binding protein [Desulfobacterales bacterium]|nr:MAG: AMP-binding protein [Desulfobacterales bacterium]